MADWHLRISDDLGTLVDEIVKQFGYSDRTACVKSLIRLTALVGRDAPGHALAMPMCHQNWTTQDKIDREILRMWRADERLDVGYLAAILGQVITGSWPAAMEPGTLDAIGRGLVRRLRE